MPPPKELSPPSFGELSPPPSRMMPPPPPPSLRELPPPPLRMMPPPPPSKFPSDHSSRKMPPLPLPPPKFPSSQLLVEEVHSQNPDLRAAASAETPVQKRVSEKATTVEPVSDSVLKLVEYDEEEEEEDDMVASAEESCRSNIMRSRSSKPFWAV